MKKQLKGYLPYLEEDYKKIWEKGLIVADTNVLLNFYKFSDEARKELWKILEDKKEKIWMPYQVAFEFLNNKDTVIENVQKSFTKVKVELTKQMTAATDILKQVDKKDIKCKEPIMNKISTTIKEIEEMLEKEQEGQQNFVEDDIVLNKILELYDGKCGTEEQKDKLEEMKKEAKRREENKIPPGYKDRKKNENFVDYYIFYSIIEKAKQEKLPIIFVTDDEKEDWYLKKEGKIISGRKELLQEFYAKTKQLLYICNTQKFLRDYSKYCGKEQTPEKILEEIEDIHQKEVLEQNIYKHNRNYMQIRTVRNKRTEFIDRIIYIRRLLNRMNYKNEDADYLTIRIEELAKQILNDISYEKYHGKIVVIMDELERNSNIEQAIAYCNELLNQIIG